MNKTYIELKTKLPFIIEYLYIDFRDITVSEEQFEYRDVLGIIDNLPLINPSYPHVAVRSIKTFSWLREAIEESLDTIGRKLRFKYPDELDFYLNTYKKIDNLLVEYGM